jgi:tetratricopeptide (TPR) repeat protein
MNMQNENEKKALVAARSTQNQPRTQVAELRDVLTMIERRIAKLKEISPEDALEILPLLDQARERLDTLEAAGGGASSERSEGTQFETLLRQLDKKGSTFMNRAGGSAALKRARQERQPDQSYWWWFIDEDLAQKRQSKIKRWAVGAAIVGALLIVLVVVYNQFLAPDPAFQAGIGFQQTAENKLIQGQYEEALADAEQAIEHLPDYPELYVLRGVLYDVLEQPDLAEQSYILAREKLSKEETFYNERAKYFLLAGLGEPGMADAEMALSINPDSAVSLMFIAQAHEMLGNISKAIDYYELASAAAERTDNPTLQVMARMQIATLLQQFNLINPETPQE